MSSYYYGVDRRKLSNKILIFVVQRRRRTENFLFHEDLLAFEMLTSYFFSPKSFSRKMRKSFSINFLENGSRLEEDVMILMTSFIERRKSSSIH